MDTRFNLKKSWLSVPLMVGAALLAGCNFDSMRSGAAGSKYATEYQAVFLDNGQVYFGKLESPESTFPVLRNVFYVQNQVNQETKQVANLLVKRGKELHEPDVMYLNQRHIVMVESVAPSSQVGQLIKKANP